MEKYNADLQKKYNKFKKRKLIQQVDLISDSEKKFCGLVSVTEDMFEHQGKKTDNLSEELLFYQEKLAERGLLELEQTKKMKGLTSEVSRLQDLLSQKNEATIISIETLQRNEATISIETAKELPKAIISEEDNASQKEIVNVIIALNKEMKFSNGSIFIFASRNNGDQIVRYSISDILRTLIENVLGMRVTFGLQSAEVTHEKSGYAFSLTWSTDGEELVYRVSSLGTLANIALKWMKEEIIFNTTMCPLFFKRICGIIDRA